MASIKLNAMVKDLGIHIVDGTLTKLKGYKKLKLYSHKIDKTWYIREFYTGRRLGLGTTEVNAKKAARNYLKEYSIDQIQTQIKSIEHINKN